MIFLLSIAISLVLVFAYRKNLNQSIVKVKAPPDYAKQLSEWVEILNAADHGWAWGKRISWLPPELFGDGACMLVGVIDLTGTDPELRRVIDRAFGPVYFDGNRLVARMLVVAGGDERLILGSIDDIATQNKIASLCAENNVDKEVCVQISSDSISPVIEKRDREKFEQIWHQYASGSLASKF
jgi:hypothetical protein